MAVSKVCDIGAHEQCSLKHCECICHGTVIAEFKKGEIITAGEIQKRMKEISNKWDPLVTKALEEFFQNMTIFGSAAMFIDSIDWGKVKELTNDAMPVWGETYSRERDDLPKMQTGIWEGFKWTIPDENNTLAPVEERKEETLKEQTVKKMKELGGFPKRMGDVLTESGRDYSPMINSLYTKMKKGR